MLRLSIDKVALGDIAEECGLQLQTAPDIWERDTHVELSIEFFCGKGRLKLYATAKKSDAVVPPIGAI